MMANTSYYAVIFTTTRSNKDDGYLKMAHEMEELASKQPGFLGFESARNELGITVSYWERLEDIAHWKNNLAHLNAQKKGREEWYTWYKVRICKVEREYEFTKDPS
jgi:heme-degrading monooxygenase HmoA